MESPRLPDRSDAMALPGLSGVLDAPAPQGEMPAHQVKWVQMRMILI